MSTKVLYIFESAHTMTLDNVKMSGNTILSRAEVDQEIIDQQGFCKTYCNIKENQHLLDEISVKPHSFEVSYSSLAIENSAIQEDSAIVFSYGSKIEISDSSITDCVLTTLPLLDLTSTSLLLKNANLTNMSSTTQSIVIRASLESTLEFKNVQASSLVNASLLSSRSSTVSISKLTLNSIQSLDRSPIAIYDSSDINIDQLTSTDLLSKGEDHSIRIENSIVTNFSNSTFAENTQTLFYVLESKIVMAERLTMKNSYQAMKLSKSSITL